MVGLNMFSKWPSIRRNDPAPVARATVALEARNTKRATTLDRVPGARPRRKADTGPDSPARFLQILVESISGKPLSSFFPVADGLPRIIGIDGLAKPAGFDSFLESFFQAMQFFTLPNQPTVRQDDGTHRRLRAGALGVRDAGNVRRATPRPQRKFDEFSAQMPSNPATLEAALAAGAGDGIPIGFHELLSAFVGAMRSAVLANDVGALHNLGEDFASLLVALHQVVNGGEGTERTPRMRKVGENHYALDGYETRRKGRAHIIGVDVDGVMAAIKDVEVAGGKFVRKRGRKLKRA